MPLIRLRPRRLEDYGAIVGANVLAMLRRLAAPLAGLRVLHLSAGPLGSAVAEMLTGLVPLQRDLGLQADWHLLRADAPRIWSALYEGLSGGSVRWGQKERQAWYAYAERHASAVAGGYDVIVAHDPQAIALATAAPAARRARWVWHCHLDTREAQAEVWADVQTALEGYAAALYASEAFVRQDLAVPRVAIARPALDPCSPRNVPLSSETVATVLGQLGIDPSRPLIGQFAPIDHRYAPIAALGTYWLARQSVPDLQIVLADSSTSSLERSRRDLEQVADAAGSDPNVHLLTTEVGLGPTELNALKHGVAVVLQLAVPRGFGWGLAECQWHGKPAVVGRHGLLPEQIGEDQSGFVVEGAPNAAAAVVRLLREPLLAATLGRRGRERVARQYLITGLLGDYLRLFRELAGVSSAAGSG